MSEVERTANITEDRDTAERRDERAKWTKDLADILRGLTADPDYAAYVRAADFLDPPRDQTTPVPAAAPVKGVTYLLWSNRHSAWWRPSAAGYTESIDLAGRYAEREAIECVVASAQCGIRTQVTCMVAAPDNWAVSDAAV